jgi:Na+/proline symporter
MPSGPGGFQPPPGYQSYSGQPMTPQGNSGMAVASMVLSLVGIIPCFFALQIPGLLGVIFGFVGLKQTKDGARKGRGMAIAGLVIGIILLVICAAVWIYFLTSDSCYRDGSTWRCTSN